MIEYYIVAFQNGLAYVRKHPELALTLVLILVVPLAFLLSGQRFLAASRDNVERLEKDRLGLLEDVFESYLHAVRFDGTAVHAELRRLGELNPDITAMELVRDDADGLQLIASLDGEAGTAPEADPSAYHIADARPDESVIVATTENGVRYWETVKAVRGEGNERYYVRVETSLAGIDALFASRVRTAYYWLFALLAVVLLLILRHVRLIDYAYLYSRTKREAELKDMFTNMIAHELRAPLTAIRGYASLMLERHLDDATRGDATKVKDSSERLLSIINDLLDVARLQSGRMSVNPTRTNVAGVIRSALDTMRAVATEKGVALGEDGVLSDAYADIDEKRLHQSLVNLISNAIKYTKSGTIAVSLDERRDRVEIRVKDTGMGISADDQKRLFAPFFRVESEEVGAVVGTGLGMWITKQLIEVMKGSIAVESIRGVGTHIVLTFPK
ncbi:MAG TPA: HAMP domain-containing sensor histidine kinase [Candidatus Paceibacterota bacterium]|nr:HAMP domain-containing sensor histidine kinase [Candidatus Paceibacterota bacterium]